MYLRAEHIPGMVVVKDSDDRPKAVRRFEVNTYVVRSSYMVENDVGQRPDIVSQLDHSAELYRHAAYRDHSAKRSHSHDCESRGHRRKKICASDR